MSWDFYNLTTQKARKEYRCDAMEIIHNSMAIEEFTQDEQVLIIKAESESCKITKGSIYTKCSGKWDGEFTVFRARIEIDTICLKYDLYAE
mgnify:CR=1 FL=1